MPSVILALMESTTANASVSRVTSADVFIKSLLGLFGEVTEGFYC